ncbi:MAG: ADP-ribosylglycohydrolase family protein, partial [bacterium]|nr:ADP-ribosylglycohydrolase family protein [bacterium]
MCIRDRKESGQWPLRGWIDYRREPYASKYPEVCARGARQQEETGMPIDDDINYTVAALKIVEEHGAEFTAADVGMFWLMNLPALQTCTAERIAYRNMLACISPPASARWRNPCREWIGAQIRADTYGYVCVGNPRQAAEFAWRDASVSHVKNGVYGSMFVAAMIAAAPYCRTPDEVVCAGLAEIPRRSRLHAEIELVRGWRASGIGYDEAVARVHERWNEADWHHWTHTISNAAVCVVALLWGEGDFSASVGMAVQACFDTDCNGATTGSIVGAMRGASAIPSGWSARIANTMRTCIPYNNTWAVDAFARRVLALRAKVLRKR